MDVSELRKRILRGIEDAKSDVAARRVIVDEARAGYASFLAEVAVPMMRQAETVLKAAGYLFDVHTPAESVRLVAEKSPHTFLEFELDASRTTPQVVGRVSLTRGRQGQIVEERPLGGSRPVSALSEEDLSAFLVTEIPRLIVKP
ncbi:MAG: hypothetical protein ABI051_01825 [Vicinamibacterales bacterium]